MKGLKFKHLRSRQRSRADASPRVLFKTQKRTAVYVPLTLSLLYSVDEMKEGEREYVQSLYNYICSTGGGSALQLSLVQKCQMGLKSLFRRVRARMLECGMLACTGGGGTWLYVSPYLKYLKCVGLC